MKSRLRRWFGMKKKQKKPGQIREPSIVVRAEHQISRANIPKFVLKVLYTLNDNGYASYLVGGGVRDLLLEKQPKDFDVATNARPEEIKKLFRNCRLIGRRFRLAHVHFGQNIVEVTTFRGEQGNSKPSKHRVHSEEGMLLRDNVYGSLEDDAFRRDFTINALYYNIADFSIVDYTNGLSDLKQRRLKIIGDPEQRYREDPVRMLRAVRFAAKLEFSIDQESEAAILASGNLLEQVSDARLLDEQVKLFLGGSGLRCFQLLRQYRLFEQLFPLVEQSLGSSDLQVEQFIESALQDTDHRIQTGNSATLVFLLAVFFWCPVMRKTDELITEGLLRIPAFYEACDWVFLEQQKHMAISKRLVQSIREIWMMQSRFERRTGKRVEQFCVHPKFRIAYDFLKLRAKIGPSETQALAQWWEQYQAADLQTKQTLMSGVKPTKRYRRKRKKQV